MEQIYKKIVPGHFYTHRNHQNEIWLALNIYYFRRAVTELGSILNGTFLDLKTLKIVTWDEFSDKLYYKIESISA